MAIEQSTVRVTTAGGDGVAAGTGYSDAIKGYLLDIYLDYHASAPATTDVTVTQEGRSGNLFARSDSATDALVAPRQGLVTNANAAITDSNAPFPVNGRLVFTLAQANALTDCLVAYVRYETGN